MSSATSSQALRWNHFISCSCNNFTASRYRLRCILDSQSSLNHHKTAPFGTTAVTANWRKNLPYLDKYFLKKKEEPKPVKPLSAKEQFIGAVKLRWNRVSFGVGKKEPEKPEEVEVPSSSILHRLKDYPTEAQRKFAKEIFHKARQTSKARGKQFTVGVINCSSYLKESFKKGSDLVTEKIPEHVREPFRELQDGSMKEYNNLSTAYKVHKMRKNSTLDDVSYRDLAAQSSFRRDKFKTLAVLTISLVPFGGPLLILPKKFNSRKTMPQTFWTDKEHRDFISINHAERLDSIKFVVDHLVSCRNNQSVMEKHGRIMEVVCDSLKYGVVLSNEVLLMMRKVCQEEPLFINNDVSNLPLLRAMCKGFGLSVNGSPEKLVGALEFHANAIRELDIMLTYEKVESLSERELLDANYMRSLDASLFSKEANEYWLKNWLKVSGSCRKGDAWFFYYAMIMHSYNYNKTVYENDGFEFNKNASTKDQVKPDDKQSKEEEKVVEA